MRDGASYDDDGDDEAVPTGGEQPQFGPRDPQPYLPRDAQFYGDQQQPRQNNNSNNNNSNNHAPANGDDVDRLPSFITGGQQQPQQPGQEAGGERYQDGDRNDRSNDNRNDRYGYRRRRHRRGGGGQRPDHNGARHESNDDSH